ncbi:Lrp/AsnC family transcriptional regulator [Methylacidimicrobium sp. B4]|uniref:Lrp/AsnC family transcriptional regulator n=1 Tax=Methylacidimicrobium sp. B4 TaxID=2796139 RepID=UPI001A90C83C|nr:Lrp/AsnC family transcriptional regulator [Methylacidimicrobium sp. B4]QSR85240.1 Lrp/AsnC family transcriptional regulator [Methylacidimicrobium sp. B4]
MNSIKRREPLPIGTEDLVNARILSVSEDKLAGFHPEPFAEIARLADLPLATVTARIRAMLEGGTIRRVRQTLLANDLAPGALIAWEIPEEKLGAAFDFLVVEDPFSGHVVLRSTDSACAGSSFRLWSTLKVPQGFSLEAHCRYLSTQIGAIRHRILRAKGIFTLGVGHVRRRTLEIGAICPAKAQMHAVEVRRLSGEQWKVLGALKEELRPEEISLGLWDSRARSVGLGLPEFVRIARELEQLGILGRFSTFLEHVKPLSTGERVTRFNGLFHWAVPQGREKEAGEEIGRFEVLTHCYWREAGPDFGNVNLMAVAHGREKDRLLLHKAAIDEHLRQVGIPVLYSNIFWGGRSEIKPSEILPEAYRKWSHTRRIDWETMRDGSS